MAQVYYSKDHEWISVDGDIATIGITNHAQEQLGDVVFVEVPETGRAVSPVMPLLSSKASKPQVKSMHRSQAKSQRPTLRSPTRRNSSMRTLKAPRGSSNCA